MLRRLRRSTRAVSTAVAGALAHPVCGHRAPWRASHSVRGGRVRRLLEPRLAPGAPVVADHAGRAPDFLDRVRSSGRYLAVDVGGDVEVALLV